MTNTLTSDANATIRQIKQLEAAGADIVRVSCPDEESTAALPAIVRAVQVPIVADIHFHYKRAIEAAKAGAACLRINPGNIGSAARVREVVQAAKDHGCSMRIGVNAGSLEKELLERYGEPCPEAMVESALNHARILEDNDFREFKISVKASDVFLAVAAYQGLAEACDDPVEEIRVGFDILKSLGLRHRGVNVIACPSCARQGFDVIKTVAIIEDRLKHITTPMSLSIIGCVVNGPGEAAQTDLGFTGGGAGAGMVYVAGKPDHKLDNDKLVDHIVALVEKRAAEIEAKRR
jgi:(E)-4-hydroxy-3-methylbut-2-enyl-diphosphate synthase